MAEGDRDTYRRTSAALAREKEIMKDVDGELAPTEARLKPLRADIFSCLVRNRLGSGQERVQQYKTLHSIYDCSHLAAVLLRGPKCIIEQHL